MMICGEASSPVGLVPPSPATASSSSISMRGESQTHLHDFSFSTLKSWGNQKVLRCINFRKNSDVAVPPSSSSSFPSRAPGPGSTARPRENMGRGDDDGALEEVREKLMVHLREATGWIDLAARDKEEVARPSPSDSAAPLPVPMGVDRPWNLRTRRSVTSNSRDPSPSLPPAQVAGEIPAKSLGSRPEKTQSAARRKFSVSLSKEEIEEDLYAVTGRRPPRRPKKRARIIQRELDFLSPGLWLSEVTADLYKVDDPAPDSGNKR